MKIYIGHSKQLNYKEFYRCIRLSEFDKKHDIILPHEKSDDPRDFVSRGYIENCDLMIAEVSYPATGLGIELGIASTAERPIICVYRKGSKISGSLKVITNNFIEYVNNDDLIAKIEGFGIEKINL